MMLYYSITNMNLALPWKSEIIGLANYVRSVYDPLFINSIIVLLKYLGGALFIEVLLGFLLAIALMQPIRLSSVFRTILVLPLAVTPAAVGILGRLVFDPQTSFLNKLLELVGLSPPSWLGDPTMALITLMITDAWQWTPFIALIVLGGFLSVPQEIIESARIDGAEGASLYRNILIPLAKPMIFTAVVMRLLDLAKDFDKIFVLTGGGPASATEVMSLYIFRQAFWFFEIGYASCLAIIYLIVVSIIFTVAFSKVRIL